MQAVNDEKLGMFSSFGQQQRKKIPQSSPQKWQESDQNNVSGCFNSNQEKDQMVNQIKEKTDVEQVNQIKVDEGQKEDEKEAKVQNEEDHREKDGKMEDKDINPIVESSPVIKHVLPDPLPRSHFFYKIYLSIAFSASKPSLSFLQTLHLFPILPCSEI